MRNFDRGRLCNFRNGAVMTIQVKEYDVIRMAVADGARSGVYQYFKHKDEALSEDERDMLSDQVTDSVMSSILDWFVFDDPVD